MHTVHTMAVIHVNSLISLAQEDLFHQAPLLLDVTKCFQPDPPFHRSSRACSSTTSIVSMWQVPSLKSDWLLLRNQAVFIANLMNTVHIYNCNVLHVIHTIHVIHIFNALHALRDKHATLLFTFLLLSFFFMYVFHSLFIKALYALFAPSLALLKPFYVWHSFLCWHGSHFL